MCPHYQLHIQSSIYIHMYLYMRVTVACLLFNQHSLNVSRISCVLDLNWNYTCIPYSIISLTLLDISASWQKIVNNFAFIVCFQFALFMTFNCQLCEKKPNELLLIVNVLLLLLLFIRLNMRNAIAINFYELSICFFFFYGGLHNMRVAYKQSHIIISYRLFSEWTWNLNAFYICAALVLFIMLSISIIITTLGT